MESLRWKYSCAVRDRYNALPDEVRNGDGAPDVYRQTRKQVEREMMQDKMLAYTHYKNLYESTKPIRGRAEDIRPIGQRRRDWELIIHKVEDGQDVYCARLYNTDVVKYYPDGSVKLCIDSWATPLTAEFMHTHSPFYCYKRYNKIWVRLRGEDEDKHYPIDRENGLLLVSVNGRYEPSEPVVVKQKVVDRQKAKDARAPLKPFLDWAKMFLKLSDGWIMAETKEQIATPRYEYWNASYMYNLPEIKNNNGWGRDFYPEPLIKFLQETDEEGYLKALCIISESLQPQEVQLHKVVENPENHNRQIKVHNYRYSYESIKAKLYRVMEQTGDIYKEVEVAVGDKALTKVI